MRRSPSGASPWSGVSYAILSLFIILFFFLGLTYRRPHFDFGFGKKKHYDFPDFDNISFTRTLTSQHINLDSNERIIFIGDVHGMNHSLADLLSELSYDQSKDIIMFAGDLLAKSTHTGSLSVLDFLVENHELSSAPNQTERIFAIRGNHDQLVVQWRSWREWFQKLNIPAPSDSSEQQEQVLTNGKEFIALIESEWASERRKREADADEWVDVARKRAEGTWREEWWRRIPPPGTGKKSKDWKLFGDHYWLARDMTADHAAFLFSLPLINYVPSLHLFVVHAGLLPYNPRLPIDDPHQPLAHAPKAGLPPVTPSDEDNDQELNFSPPEGQDLLRKRDQVTDDLRRRQEEALLSDIPQNKDQWVVLNMRGVKKNGKVTRDNDVGTPWSKLWNRQMKQCSGILSSSFLQPLQSSDGEDDPDGMSFPCEPSTVIYGHAASRGLDVKRYSMGLDTGCLYGQQLTALVVTRPSSSGPHTDEDEGEKAADQNEGEDKRDSEANDHHEHRRIVRRKRASRRQHKEADRKSKVKFGDADMGLDARLVQVHCALPPESDPHDH